MARRADTGDHRFPSWLASLGKESEEGEVKEERQITVFGIFAVNLKSAPINVYADFQALLNASGKWRLIVMVGDSVTSDAVSERLFELAESKVNVDIFYIAAHGGNGGNGVLLSDKLVSPAWIAKKAEAHQVSLVILAACRTAKVASALRRSGVPTVIYMQRDVKDKDALDMIEPLLNALNSGYTAAAAVDHARSFVDDIIGHSTLHVIGDEDLVIK